MLSGSPLVLLTLVTAGSQLINVHTIHLISMPLIQSRVLGGLELFLAATGREAGYTLTGLQFITELLHAA